MKLVDCQGLAGFMSLGFVNNGFTIAHRTGTLDFGNAAAEENRHLLGYDWDADFSDDPNDWDTFNDVDVVAGCPPCSGWSTWSGTQYRGPDSPAHAHTRAFIQYAGRQAPRAVVWECVQQAFSQGRSMMVEYRDALESVSGKQYDLYHVKHNNLQLGGFSYRSRYFWVAVEKGLPFGVNMPELKSLPTMNEVIGDLADLDWQWSSQPYRDSATGYVSHLRSQNGRVDGHIGRSGIHRQRISDLFDAVGGSDGWPSGRNGSTEAVLKRVVDETGEFPGAWANLGDRLTEKDMRLGFSQPYRWNANSWCNVLTGSALDHVVHPTRPRLLSHRECARIQGLPDSWLIEPVQNYSALPSIWGKAVPLQAATWIAGNVKTALEGGDVGDTGELIGDREWLIYSDAGFSRQAVKKRWYSSEEGATA